MNTTAPPLDTALDPTVLATLTDLVGPLGEPPHTVLAGSGVIRASVTTQDGAHLWVDAVDPAARRQKPGRRTREDSWPPELADQGTARISAPAQPGLASARIREVPWPATLLTSVPRHEAAHAVGALLRRIHSYPEVNPATPQAVTQLTTHHSPLLTDARIAAIIERFRVAWSESTPVRLHGAPGSGHVLVPCRAEHGVEAVLLAQASAAGPAWFDVGHLIGDLAEVVHMHGLPSLSSSIRSGYDGDSPMPAHFWEHAHDAAVVAVLAHGARVEENYTLGDHEIGFLRRVVDQLIKEPT